jgi:hypothetical protein
VGVVAYLFVAGEVGLVAFLLLGHSFLLVFGVLVVLVVVVRLT